MTDRLTGRLQPCLQFLTLRPAPGPPLPLPRLLHLFRQWGNTPVHVAASTGNESAVRKLVANKVKNVPRNQEGRLPFEVAKTPLIAAILTTGDHKARLSVGKSLALSWRKACTSPRVCLGGENWRFAVAQAVCMVTRGFPRPCLARGALEFKGRHSLFLNETHFSYHSLSRLSPQAPQGGIDPRDLRPGLGDSTGPHSGPPRAPADPMGGYFRSPPMSGFGAQLNGPSSGHGGFANGSNHSDASRGRGAQEPESAVSAFPRALLHDLMKFAGLD